MAVDGEVERACLTVDGAKAVEDSQDAAAINSARTADRCTEETIIVDLLKEGIRLTTRGIVMRTSSGNDSKIMTRMRWAV